jgi:hypothetical protein
VQHCVMKAMRTAFRPFLLTSLRNSVRGIERRVPLLDPPVSVPDTRQLSRQLMSSPYVSDVVVYVDPGAVL